MRIVAPVSRHIGNGAHVTFDADGDLVFSADHRDPRLASSVVVVPPEGFAELREFLRDNMPRIFK